MISVPILQIGKWRHREVKRLTKVTQLESGRAGILNP